MAESFKPAMSSAAALTIARWYAVYTRSNFERHVSGDLAAKDVQTYLPATREVHRWKDRRKEVEVPVFPGYVFVRMTDEPENRLRVLRTTGAVRILGNNGAMEPIPDAEIEAIRQLLETGAPFLRHPFLREGALVRVKYGPLAGIEGRLVRIKNQGRLVLSIDLLSQAVAAEINAADVEVLRPPTRPIPNHPMAR